MSEKLKPCPFCGEEKYFLLDLHHIEYECGNCGTIIRKNVYEAEVQNRPQSAWELIEDLSLKYGKEFENNLIKYFNAADIMLALIVLKHNRKAEDQLKILKQIQKELEG